MDQVMSRRKALGFMGAVGIAGLVPNTAAIANEPENTNIDRRILPPRDETAGIEMWGQWVPDPYKALKGAGLYDRETRSKNAWLSAEEERLNAYLAPEQNRISQIKHLLEPQEASPVITPPQHLGENWVRLNHGLEFDSLQVSKSKTGPWEDIIEFKGGFIGGFWPSPDGQWIAFQALELFTDTGGLLKFVDVEKKTTFVPATYAVGRTSLEIIQSSINSANLNLDIGNCFAWTPDSNEYYFMSMDGNITQRPLTRLKKVELTGADSGIHFEILPSGKDYHVPLPDFAHEKSDTGLPGKELIHLPDNVRGMPFISKVSGDIEFLEISYGFTDKGGLWMREKHEKGFEQVIEPGQETLEIIDYIDGYIYALTQGEKRSGQVVKFSLSSPSERTIIIPEKDNEFIRDYFSYDNRIYVKYRKNVNAEVLIYDINSDKTSKMPIPKNVDVAFVNDSQNNNGFDIYITSYVSSPTLYHYSADNNELTLVETPQPLYSLEDCIVEQRWATSRDGTRVPMTIIRHPDTEIDGTAATMITCYGGANMSMGAQFSSQSLAWVRSGGIYVQANLRGGAEFGDAWNQAGSQKNKPNTLDDLAACAAFLQKEDYTSASRTVIDGASLGGTVVLATMQKYPQLFGAVIATAPGTDFIIEEYKVPDFGDPRKDEELFHIISGYNPLLNIKLDIKYPPHLIWQGTHDKLVSMSNATKFLAQSEYTDRNSRCFLYLEQDGDHFPPTAISAFKERAERFAIMIGFAEAAIGPLNQLEYKQSLVVSPKNQPSRIPSAAP